MYKSAPVNCSEGKVCVCVNHPYNHVYAIENVLSGSKSKPSGRQFALPAGVVVATGPIKVPQLPEKQISPGGHRQSRAGVPRRPVFATTV